MHRKESTYCLKWNNVSTELELLSTFRELRENNELFDVSLGCSEGFLSNTKPFRAHKAILSAYSPVFKEMLCSGPSVPDSMIYLTKMSQNCLTQLIDFMYNGEVNVFESDLSSFMAIAEELQIRGLKSKSDANLVDSFMKKPKNKPSKKSSKPLDDDADYIPEESLLTTNVKQEKSSNLLKLKNTKKKLEEEVAKLLKDERLSKSLSADQDFGEMENENDYLKQDENLSLDQGFEEENEPTEEELRRKKVENFMEKTDKFTERPGGMKRFHSRCKLCGKETRTDEVKKHILKHHAASLTE